MIVIGNSLKHYSEMLVSLYFGYNLFKKRGNHLNDDVQVCLGFGMVSVTRQASPKAIRAR